MVQSLRLHKPFQVHVVCQDLEMDPLEVLAPMLQTFDDCEELLVVGIVIVLRLDQLSRKEVYWPPLVLSKANWAVLA